MDSALPQMYQNSEQQLNFEKFVWNFLKIKFEEQERIKHTIQQITIEVQEYQRDCKLNQMFIEYVCKKYTIDIRTLERYILGSPEFFNKYQYNLEITKTIPRMQADEYNTLKKIIHKNLYCSEMDDKTEDKNVCFVAVYDRKFTSETEAKKFGETQVLKWFPTNCKNLYFYATVDLIKCLYTVSSNIRKIFDPEFVNSSYYVVEFKFSNYNEYL